MCRNKYVHLICLECKLFKSNFKKTKSKVVVFVFFFIYEEQGILDM